MTHQITRLVPESSARAAELVHAFKGSSRTLPSLEEFLRNPAHYLLVAEVEGEAAGFLSAYRLDRADREDSQMFIYEIEVAERWRRQGLARELLRSIRTLAREEGMFETFVLTSRHNDPACKLYTRTGGTVEDDDAVLFVYPSATKTIV